MMGLTFEEAVDRCPFRSVITLTGAMEPILVDWR